MSGARLLPKYEVERSAGNRIGGPLYSEVRWSFWLPVLVPIDGHDISGRQRWLIVCSISSGQCGRVSSYMNRLSDRLGWGMGKRTSLWAMKRWDGPRLRRMVRIECGGGMVVVGGCRYWRTDHYINTSTFLYHVFTNLGLQSTIAHFWYTGAILEIPSAVYEVSSTPA